MTAALLINNSKDKHVTFAHYCIVVSLSGIICILTCYLCFDNGVQYRHIFAAVYVDPRLRERRWEPSWLSCANGCAAQSSTWPCWGRPAARDSSAFLATCPASTAGPVPSMWTPQSSASVNATNVPSKCALNAAFTQAGSGLTKERRNTEISQDHQWADSFCDP